MLHFEYTIYSAVLIVILALIMLLFNLRSNKSIFFLFGFLILHAVYGITHTLLAFGDPTDKTTLFFTTLLLNNAAPLWWLRGPFLYFYVRSILNDNPKLSKSDLLHFLPFAINLVAIIPYLMTSWNYKTIVSEKAIGDVRYILNYNFELFYPHMINNYLRPIQLLAYIVTASCLLIRFYPRLQTIKGNLSKQYREVFFWLSGLLLLLFGNTIFINYITFRYFRAPFLNHLSPPILSVYSISNALFCALPILILVFPSIMYGMPKLSLKISASGAKSGDSTGENKEAVPHKKFSIDEEHFIQLSDEIIRFMENEKPYLNPDFSFYDLCVGMKTPQHHLRFCLNGVIKKSFSDLKNEMRVNHAISMLNASMAETISIDGIGKASGYKSSSNFYTSFKEKTGFTPSEWLRGNQ
jgi:AraC-like DNA-binding protein